MKTSLRGWSWMLLVGLVLLGPMAPNAAGAEIEMQLRSSNGYRLGVFAAAGTYVSFSLAKKVGRGVVYAEYSTDGVVTRDGLRANFGRYGRISVTFHPSSRRPGTRSSCKRRGSIELIGRFEGTIRLRGERDYSSVSASGAKGTMHRGCKARSRPVPAALPSRRRGARDFETSFVAVGRSGVRSATLISEGLFGRPPGEEPPSSKNLTLVEVEEERGRISIERTAIVASRPIASSPLGTIPVTASLTLPRPFSGVGSYREEANAPASWTGDLQVDLPGAENVPLAGPAFTALLCRGMSGDPELRRCLRETPEPGRPARLP
jgi:hypothetical protein